MAALADARREREKQREEIRSLIIQDKKNGDIWFLVDVKWMKKWKKYVGYEQTNRGGVGRRPPHPGPVDSVSLFAVSLTAAGGDELKEHLMEVLDYSLVPEAAWEKLVQWYGMTANSRPIARKVVLGKVDVYLVEFKLCVHPNVDDFVMQKFSRNDTVVDLEATMRRTFGIPPNTLCRVWYWDMKRWGQLNSPSQTLRHAELFNMSIISIEIQNEDGTWPRDNPKCSAIHPVLHLRDSSTLSEDEIQSLQQQFCDSMFQSKPHIDVQGMREELALLATTPLSLTPEQVTQLHQYVSRSIQQKDAAGKKTMRREENEVLKREYEEMVMELEEQLKTQTQMMAQQQSYRDELVQRIDSEARKANAAHQQAQNALGRLAQQEDMIQSLNKSMKTVREEKNQSALQVSQLEKKTQELSREISRAQVGRSEALARAARAEQTITQLRSQQQELWESLDTMEQRKNEANQRAAAAESRAAAAEQSTATIQDQLENRIAILQNQLEDAEQQLQGAYQRIDEQQGIAARTEAKLRHSDQVFQDIFQRLIGQIPQSRPHWVVQRNEIQLTNEVLGSGGWASVKVAIFRNDRVAAKCLHHQIVSAHNMRLFTREMNVAANARHPHLLQFIGATLDSGEPIILTELMLTSLRHVLEGDTTLSRPQIVTISHHVALALNYLHLMQPEAIIHRDVSSANVLLEPQGQNWKAKLSDYGSANFVHYTTTAGPGNPTYAAPEANDPQRQSPKMDVFSFSVLLVEMCSGELPLVEHRDHLLTVIHWPPMLALIHQGLRHEPQRRPAMATIITELDQLAV